MVAVAGVGLPSMVKHVGGGLAQVAGEMWEQRGMGFRAWVSGGECPQKQWQGLWASTGHQSLTEWQGRGHVPQHTRLEPE